MNLSLKAAFAALLLAGSAGAVQAYDGEQFVVCKLNPNGDNFLALRTCGATSCKMISKLGPGTFVITMEPYETNGWREIIVQSHIEDWSYGGRSGWVYGRYICEVRY
ncbi:MAG: hypothetical protein GY945_15040 [Rhodobacteraceae bacterium]|nr:hypothetical protein [Paracoccaceae bacterium]